MIGCLAGATIITVVIIISTTIPHLVPSGMVPQRVGQRVAIGFVDHCNDRIHAVLLEKFRSKSTVLIMYTNELFPNRRHRHKLRIPALPCPALSTVVTTTEHSTFSIPFRSNIAFFFCAAAPGFASRSVRTMFDATDSQKTAQRHLLVVQSIPAICGFIFKRRTLPLGIEKSYLTRSYSA